MCLQCSWVMVSARRQVHAVAADGNSGVSAELQGGQGGAWQRKTYMFCLNEVAEIKCDGPDQMMQVSSAMYNRNTKTVGSPCALFESEWKSCKVNAQKMVEEQCQGTSGCHLIPSDHATCEDEAFQQMRLVIKCRTAGEGESVKTQPPRPGLSTTPEPPAPLEVKHAELQGDIQPAIVKELNDDHLEEVSFTPCFRSLTVEKVIEGDIESDSWRAQLASSVTSCGSNDGCFHLTFPDGVVYNDGSEPPPPDELIKGELKEVGENMWVTYEGVGLKNIDYGIGLKRNDYGTWGICLPKTQTLRYAVALWDTMKTVFKKHATTS